VLDDINTKSARSSGTIWAIIGMAIVAIGSLFGVAFTDGDAEIIGAALGSIVTGILSLVGIYRRIRASQKIG
jgi:hypothetical protein